MKRRRGYEGDLVGEVAKVVSTKKEAQAAVDCVFDAITKTLKKKGEVTLVGFGTFKVSKQKARKGRNPKSVVSRTSPTSDFDTQSSV